MHTLEWFHVVLWWQLQIVNTLGLHAGSTTAEGACESVRQACEQLLENSLQPQIQEMQQSEAGFKGDSAEALWKKLIQAVSNPNNFPNKQLTAYALFDGSRRDKAPGQHLLNKWRFHVVHMYANM